MKTKDLKKIEKYFTMYSDSDYQDYWSSNPEKCKRYFHKMEEFHIIVFEDNSVYQLGTEAEPIGVELETLEDFKIRFKSFTGEDVENIGDEEEPEDIFSDLKDLAFFTDQEFIHNVVAEAMKNDEVKTNLEEK